MRLLNAVADPEKVEGGGRNVWINSDIDDFYKKNVMLNFWLYLISHPFLILLVCLF